MGNPAKKFTHIADLVVEENVQIRDNAIEATRIAINRFLNNKIGKENYFMRIRIYPFHILRENKQAQGAHADRIQKGMSHAFGKPIGRAARIKAGQTIMSILIDEIHIPFAKQALLRAQAKMPAKLSVTIDTDVESIGTRPRVVKEITAEEIAAQEAAGKAKGEKKEGKEAKAAAGGEAKKEEAKQGAGTTKGTAGGKTAETKKEEKKK
jgi:large subunit ribosomal protein L10e